MQLLESLKVPHESVNDDFVTVVKLYKQSNEFVNAGEVVLDIETSKTIISLEVQSSGYIEMLCKVDDEVKIGADLANIYSSLKNEKVVWEEKAEIKGEGPFPLFSNKALKFLEQNRISKESFAGKSFVKLEDIQTVFEPASQNISATKKTEITFLQKNDARAFSSNISVLVDNDGLSKYARRNHQHFLLSIVPTLLKITAVKLGEYPLLNSCYDDGEMKLYKEVQIGYALDGEFGLKVVTLNNIQNISVHEVENQLVQKIDAYKTNSLRANDLTGSTFTVTDLSFNGVSSFVPIINYRQSAILGISSVNNKTNQFEITVTFDHRITEGKYVAEFLNEIKNEIQNLQGGKK